MESGSSIHLSSSETAARTFSQASLKDPSSTPRSHGALGILRYEAVGGMGGC